MRKHRRASYPIGDLFCEYISMFSPIAPSVGETHQEACQTYTVLGLEGGKVLATKPSGNLVIHKKEATTEKQYGVSFTKQPADIKMIQATLTMSDEPLRGLMHWCVDVTPSRLHPELRSCSKTRETGHFKDNTIVIQRGDRKIIYEHTNCLHTQWTLPDVFSEVKAAGKAYEFDLLHNAQVFRPGQVLTYEGESEVSVKGQRVTWEHYLHLGYGTLPTSYLVDARGVVQIVTGGVNTLALIGMELF